MIAQDILLRVISVDEGYTHVIAASNHTNLERYTLFKALVHIGDDLVIELRVISLLYCDTLCVLLLAMLVFCRRLDKDDYFHSIHCSSQLNPLNLILSSF
jgi:hypothetical protein